MVLLLGTTLGVSLRQVNVMLAAAGHDPVFDGTDDELPPVVIDALDLIKEHHEPFPVFVIDRTYRVRDLNRGALAVLRSILGAGGLERSLADAPPNLALLAFDPTGAQPAVANFDEVGRDLLWRIQREVLQDPDDSELGELLERLLAMPTVDPEWRRVDLSVPSDPALVVRLRHAGGELGFLVAVTAFQAPQNVAVEELRIETWFPADPSTAEACRVLAAT